MQRWFPEIMIFSLTVVLGTSVVIGRPDHGLDAGIVGVLGFCLGVYMARR